MMKWLTGWRLCVLLLGTVFFLVAKDYQEWKKEKEEKCFHE